MIVDIKENLFLFIGFNFETSFSLFWSLHLSKSEIITFSINQSRRMFQKEHIFFTYFLFVPSRAKITKEDNFDPIIREFYFFIYYFIILEKIDTMTQEKFGK